MKTKDEARTDSEVPKAGVNDCQEKIPWQNKFPEHCVSLHKYWITARRSKRGDCRHELRHVAQQRVKKCIFGEAAIDFRQALENDFLGAFFGLVFAITGGSFDRRFSSTACEYFFLPCQLSFDPTGLST